MVEMTSATLIYMSQWCRPQRWITRMQWTSPLWKSLRLCAWGEWMPETTMTLYRKGIDRQPRRGADWQTRLDKLSVGYLVSLNWMLPMWQLMRMRSTTLSTFWTNLMLIMTSQWSSLTSRRLWSFWMRQVTRELTLREASPFLPSKTTKSPLAKLKANLDVLASKAKCA